MTLQVSEKPLLTFALYAHNEERYVRGAIEGAFSQTYQPLQIILSDDGSTDNTFQIMQSMAAAYKGPHRITLNRNPKNLGVVQHVNRIMQLADGELIIAAHGDDISFANRAEVTWQMWEKTSRKASSIAMGWESICEEPGIPPRPVPTPVTDLNAAIRRASVRVVGAAYAWHRRLFDVFGPLPEYLHVEDIHLPFRSLLLGGIAFDTTPVCKYRQHTGNYLSPYHPDFRSAEGRTLRWQKKLSRNLSELRGFRAVLEKALERGLVTSEQFTQFMATIEVTCVMNEFQLEFTSTSFRRRVRAAMKLWRPGVVTEYSTRRKLFYIIASVMPRFGDTLYSMLARRRNVAKAKAAEL